MNYYVSEIDIKQLHGLQNLKIKTEGQQRNIIITGKNGSGKTSLLREIAKYLDVINEGRLYKKESRYQRCLNEYADKAKKTNSISEQNEFDKQKAFYEAQLKYKEFVELQFNSIDGLDGAYSNGEFITAFYEANRNTNFLKVTEIKKIVLAERYSRREGPIKLLLQYMTHLKTQQSYAKNDDDNIEYERIKKWFDRYEMVLAKLLDSEGLKLHFERKNYLFTIKEQGKDAYSFEQLSDGYASVIEIVTDLMLRMDRNWLDGKFISNYNLPGIVLIDEIETHLHIALQKKILPALCELFPNIQFIISTHSPYILTSCENVVVYDLEKKVQVNNMSSYSVDDVAEAYFDADSYSHVLRAKYLRYVELRDKLDISQDERVERIKLLCQLRDVKDYAYEMNRDLKRFKGDIPL